MTLKFTFPTSFAWKHLLKNKLHQSAISTWDSRTLTYDFSRFRTAHSEYTPHCAWYVSKESPKYFFHSNNFQLAEMPMNSEFCMYCNLYYNNNNIVNQCINTCAYFGYGKRKSMARNSGSSQHNKKTCKPPPPPPPWQSFLDPRMKPVCSVTRKKILASSQLEL